ncbi:MAG: transposase [Chloroflexi bacterium]|jgi:transposase|nr:transposase [Chloroflexota bacterium]
MPRGYSRDLRERLLQAIASGLAVSEVASRTGVSTKSLRRWQQKQRQGHSLEPGRPPGGPRKIPVADEPALAAQVAATPDATLAEHGAAWAAAGHAPVSTATMSRTLHRLGLPLKKRL